MREPQPIIETPAGWGAAHHDYCTSGVAHPTLQNQCSPSFKGKGVSMDLDSIIYQLAQIDCQILDYVGLKKIAIDLGCYPFLTSRLAAELDFLYWLGAFTGFGIISVVLSILGSLFGLSKKEK